MSFPRFFRGFQHTSFRGVYDSDLAALRRPRRLVIGHQKGRGPIDDESLGNTLGLAVQQEPQVENGRVRTTRHLDANRAAFWPASGPFGDVAS